MPTIVSRSGVGRKGISKKNSVCLRRVSPGCISVAFFRRRPFPIFFMLIKAGGKGGKRRRVGQKQRKARFVPGRRERRKKKIMLAEGGRKKAKTGGE